MKKLIVLSILVVLTGCSTLKSVTAVSRYDVEKTAELNKINNSGEGHKNIETDFLFGGFDRVEGQEYIVFNATIVNKSDKTVEYSANDIYGIPIVKEADGTEKECYKERVAAPGEVIGNIKMKQKEYENKEKENTSGVVESVYELGVLTTGTGKEKDKIVEENEKEDRARENAIRNQDILKDKAERYEKIFLRKGVLNPNEQISGKVYFRRDIDAEMLKVYFPIENNSYLFQFKLSTK